MNTTQNDNKTTANSMKKGRCVCNQYNNADNVLLQLQRIDLLPGKNDAGMVKDFAKVSKDNFPASLFAVPLGYKEEKDDF